MAYQDDYTKTQVRLPKELHAKIQAAASESGRSMNAEFIALLKRALIVPEDIALACESLPKITDRIDFAATILEKAGLNIHFPDDIND